MKRFPADFLWGAATSAHQVEGNNINSDWWEWEKSAGLKEISGAACRHYDLYEEDFDLAAQMGHNCHRLSIEWSRVEPENGVFSRKEIAHYVEVIAALKKRGLEPVVTLHHFTNPVWFKNIGAWAHKDSPLYFERYVREITSALADKVTFWVTVNEPTVYAYYSYMDGRWPPQERSMVKMIKVLENLSAAHRAAYKSIHSIYGKKSAGRVMVSIAHHMRAFVPRDNSFKNRLGSYLRDLLFNRIFLKKILRSGTLDYIGINYYTREVVDVKNWNLKSLLMDVYSDNTADIKKNSLGWEIYPQGLLANLIGLKKYGLPVFILENGICTCDDPLRRDFIIDHLNSVLTAIEHGVNVLGYTYWSLLDNFEWADGYAPRFGLVEVDYNTCKRTIRESAKKYAEICRTGILG